MPNIQTQRPAVRELQPRNPRRLIHGKVLDSLPQVIRFFIGSQPAYLLGISRPGNGEHRNGKSAAVFGRQAPEPERGIPEERLTGELEVCRFAVLLHNGTRMVGGQPTRYLELLEPRGVHLNSTGPKLRFRKTGRKTSYVVL